MKWGCRSTPESERAFDASDTLVFRPERVSPIHAPRCALRWKATACAKRLRPLRLRPEK
jgi:hypothetical protein